ncbi:hypothetical protein CGCTS75_v005714 [Colletotrichum tropicale]|nr:hypothetical protein CGCTS75_v005714 [Colletotrichum tropicale]
MSTSPDHIFERGHHNQTPLHIAVYWPDGLILLFELAQEACHDIIDEKDKTGLTAIQCAIDWQQAESVKLFLEKGAIINLEDTENFFTREALFPLSHHTTTVCEILAKELAKQRKSMRDYAFDQLPDEEMERFQLGRKVMLQGEAYDVIGSLKAAGVWVPGEYKLVRPGSIYHSPVMTATIAEALFQAGFCEFDSMWQGYTPLMVVAHLDLWVTSRLVHWFYEHQANLFTPIPHLSEASDGQELNTNEKDFKVIHRLAYLLGLWTSRRARYSPQPPVLPGRLFTSAPRDPCQCYCAPNGCTPASVLAKGWLRACKDSGGLDEEACSVHGRRLCLLLEENQDVPADVIRVFTFERLGMRHTCCEHNEYDARVEDFDILHFAAVHGFVSVMDPFEVAEIRGDACDNGNAGEDRYLAKDLEELITEFRAALNDFEDFEEFWDFWDSRLDRFEQEKPMMSRNSRQGLSDLGVRLERVREIESDEEASSFFKC